MLGLAFKVQCERRSVELRLRAGLEPIAPLRAVDVARIYRATVWPIERLAGVPRRDRVHLVTVGRSEWLGFTLHIGDRHLIVPNMALPRETQNSVVMHEVAHVMLGHGFAAASPTAGPIVGTYDQDQEDEAAWLGSALILPRPAFSWMRRQGMSDSEAAIHFGISPALLAWRVRMLRASGRARRHIH